MNRRLLRRHPSRTLVALAMAGGLAAYTAARIAAAGTITITGCTAPCVLKAGPDFATDTLADPWDFNERSDVGIDPLQMTNISNFSMASGIVSGTATSSAGHFTLLDQPWSGIINPGKTGRKYPINTTQYTKLAVKLNLATSTFSRVYWFHNDLGQADASGWLLFDKDVATPVGNNIYVIDLTQVNQNGINQGTPWTSGNVEGLALYPSNEGSPVNFSYDWVRLTAGDSSSSAVKMTFSWSGTSGGDVTVTDSTGATYTIQKGAPASGSVIDWNYGVLAPGTYTLNVGGATSTFTVNAPPLIHLTDPDETGGADFATDVLKNPWDMSDFGDINEDPCCIRDHLINQSFAGSVFNATSDGVAVGFAGSIPVGDPQVYLLSNPRTSNTTNIIDTTKYHRLTFDMTVDRAFDLARGSVMRVFWGSNSSDSAPGGTPYEVTTTKDVIVWPGKNTYSLDLSTLTAANGGLEPTGTVIPWSQQPVRHFRIDPHEFAEQLNFHMDNVKLAADDETASNSFTIKWTGSDANAGDSPTVALYYQPAGGGLTLITAGVSLAAGQYVWNTAGVPNGTYYILAVASDGRNSTSQYSTGPLKVSTFAPASNPQIGVDTPTANQTVTSSFEIGGWLLDAAAPSGTGVDDVKIYVQLPGAPAPGVFIGRGRLGLSRADVAAIYGSQFINSGFHFTITGLSPGPATLWVVGHSTVSNADSVTKSVPFTVSATGLMSVDIPTSETTITANSFGVSGWAIDRAVESTTQSGTGIDNIVVYAFHNPGSGEPAVLLGLASYGAIQRPDVASFYGSRYLQSGYVFTVDRAAAGLGTGEYNIVPIAHNTITNTYSNLAIVRVVLQ